MTDLELAPGVTVPTLERLGDRARPAGGRAPFPRRTYSVCTIDELEQTRARGVLTLERVTGPLRCTEVTVEVAVGKDAAAELLADLGNRGVGPDVLRRLIAHYGRITAAGQHLGRGPAALLVATCGALTGQSHASVPYT